jgi:hypothetical protein
MVSKISETLIDELLDLNVEYELETEEIMGLIPLFNFFEKKRKTKSIQILSEEPVSKKKIEENLGHSKFTSTKVKETLKNTIQEKGVCITITSTSNSASNSTNTIRLCIFGKTNEEISLYKTKLLEALNFVLSLAETTDKLNSVNIFLTDLEKEIHPVYQQKVSLTSEEVNTGVTYFYGSKNDIYLWRKEEIVKVMIHELIHSLDWDIRKSETEIFGIFSKKLKITKKILLSEAYTEAWAEIINCYILSLSDKKKEDRFSRFIHYLEIETLFSVWQTVKIIHISSDKIETNTLDTFLRKTDKETNVFPYYLLTAAILFNVSNWWCLNGQPNFIASHVNNENMANFLVEAISSKQFYSLCKKVKNNYKKNKGKKIYTSMRMSVFEDP